MLFQHFERYYPYFLAVTRPAEECLTVPFYVGGKTVGTIWAIMHSDRRKFDRKIGAASFEESENEGVSFVLDLSEQKRAEERGW